MKNRRAQIPHFARTLFIPMQIRTFSASFKPQHIFEVLCLWGEY